MLRIDTTLFLVLALLGACATKSDADETGDSSTGEEVTIAASTTTTTTATTTGGTPPGLPGDCISCSFILGFAGMGGGMMPPADGGMMPPADGGGLPMPELCEGADALLTALVECGCTGSCAETCTAACGAAFGIQSIECFSCAVADPACAGSVAACEADDPGQLDGTGTGGSEGDASGSSAGTSDDGGATGTTG